MIDDLIKKGTFKCKWFVAEVLPSRQGKTYGSPRKDGKPKSRRYEKRVKITATKALKDIINNDV